MKQNEKENYKFITDYFNIIIARLPAELFIVYKI